MEKRGKEWANRGVSIWPALAVDMVVVRAAELEERKAQAAKYSLDKLSFDPEAKALFDALRLQILALGHDVIELNAQNSVSYHIIDFFVEVMPRRQYLVLIVNLDFAECHDPSRIATDGSKRRYINNASNAGGTLFQLRTPAQIKAAIHVIRQGYQSVNE